MAHYHRLIFFLCCLYPSITFATLGSGVGEVNLAGWIKQTDGTYAKAFTNADGTGSKVTLTSAPKGITTTSTALVQTSKGAIGMDIEKTVNVATSRLGPAVAAFAKKAGPLGMAVTAASLVCELTNICNQAGEWLMKTPGLPDGNSMWICYGSTELSLNVCRNDQTLGYACGKGNVTCDSDAVASDGLSYTFKRYISGTFAGTITLTRSTPVTVENTYAPLANSDWDNAATKLNDDRFTPHLIDAGESVPTDAVPTLTPGQKRDLGKDVEPTKDSSGNITGRKETTTAAEVVDNGTADKPGSVIIKETKVTNYYDNSNTLINSETSTSYTNQPTKEEPSQITISFDTVPEATLQTYSIPNTFASNSWGSGSCPPNIDVTLTNFAFTIPTQPVCDTAEMINPFVLLIASLIGIYIISGVRGGNAT
jgi:hypothetical protein